MRYFVINTLILDLLLKQHIVCGGRLKSVSQVLRDYHVHYIDELNVDAVLVESAIQIVHQSGCELTFDVTDLADLDASDIVSDGLLALLGQQLFKFVRTKVIKKLLTVVLPGGIRTYMEGDTNIH